MHFLRRATYSWEWYVTYIINSDLAVQSSSVAYRFKQKVHISSHNHLFPNLSKIVLASFHPTKTSLLVKTIKAVPSPGHFLSDFPVTYTLLGPVYTAGFFDKYSQSCIEKHECQERLLLVDEPSSQVAFYNLFTVGAQEMITSLAGTTRLAKDNQMLISTSPWISTIAAWTKREGSSLIIKAVDM